MVGRFAAAEALYPDFAADSFREAVLKFAALQPRAAMLLPADRRVVEKAAAGAIVMLQRRTKVCKRHATNAGA